MNRIQSRRVLVFGGSRGIGEAVATAFSQAGDVVSIAARNPTETAVAASRLRATSFVCDISDAHAVERVIEACGPVDIVINAAAIQGGRGAIGPLWDTDPASFAKVIEINLLGTYNVLRAGLRQMRQNGRGSIILFSGGGSTGPRPGFDAYGASKTAVLRLAESAQAALDQEGKPIRIFTIAPGAVATAMTREVLDNVALVPQEADSAQDVADGKAGVPPTLAAELCLFLAEEAGGALSGRLVHVREDYRDYVRRDLGEHAGRLRRVDYPKSS
jgi:3-oxoacyl-[acyl-carrier protein] reductase